MTKIDDGGSAFPYTVQMEGFDRLYAGGMSLRDYFAGQALVGIAWDCGLSKQEAAETAYEFADAMLAARSMQGEG